jgi:hypothetical protein
MTTTTDLVDDEIADIMGWSPQEVRRIRTIYVDDHARIVALGRRIERGIVNRSPAGGQISAKSLICGCSSMVEQKLPKLTTRVRFPSPAPPQSPRSACPTSVKRHPAASM